MLQGNFSTSVHLFVILVLFISDKESKYLKIYKFCALSKLILYDDVLYRNLAHAAVGDWISGGDELKNNENRYKYNWYRWFPFTLIQCEEQLGLYKKQVQRKLDLIIAYLKLYHKLSRIKEIILLI